MTLHRRSSTVENLRFNTPYVAFASRDQTQEALSIDQPHQDSSGIPHAHSTSIPRPHNAQESTVDRRIHEQGPNLHSPKGSWVSNNGYGSRHASDVAPFTLWDSSRRDFRYPTPSEHAWINTTFQAVSVTYIWPDIIIETPNPPTPVPLTVACVAAMFIPVGHQITYLSTDIDYSNPRMPDPVPEHLRFHKWERASTEQYEAVLQELGKLVNIQAVNFIPTLVIVEIRTGDGRTYERRSLPGRVGGQTTLYHHSETPFWKMERQGRERLIEPSDMTQDTTNYIRELHTLCPGVRVESGTTSRYSGYLDTTMATTAGILLRSNKEGPRLTVSNHGFIDTDEVYHPSPRTGDCIGQVTERFEALDIALVKLFPSITFTNSEYFQANIPKRLLRSNEVPENTWCSLDGMASGLVFLKVHGRRFRVAPQPPGVVVPFVDFQAENIFRYVGPAGGQIREGICGSAIVVDDDKDGGVVGFFQLGEHGSEWTTCPCLDDLIDRGWTVV
ncbi:hypothetical protein DTO207G8_1044 [Paecilomyces variotii]|nr:hypothetical protein DTO207G8_1044 [Paecilomyces variotii]